MIYPKPQTLKLNAQSAHRLQQAYTFSVVLVCILEGFYSSFKGVLGLELTAGVCGALGLPRVQHGKMQYNPELNRCAFIHACLRECVSN